MSEKSSKRQNKYPPHIPESWNYKGAPEDWLGGNDFFPQLSVQVKSDVDTLKKAYQEKNTIKLHLNSRTHDMGEDEPDDDHGEFAVKILELYEEDWDGTITYINFLAEFVERHYLFGVQSAGDVLWVWEYGIGNDAGADIRIDD